jgi:hypothetical protein
MRRNFIRKALSKNVAEMTLELQVRPVIVITMPSSALSSPRRHYPAIVGITGACRH